MFLLKLVFLIVTLPLRLLLWAIGLALWVATLPIRIVFGIMGLIGFGKVVQLAIVGALGYYFYRLVNEAPAERQPGPEPGRAPSEAELERVPAT